MPKKKAQQEKQPSASANNAEANAIIHPMQLDRLLHPATSPQFKKKRKYSIQTILPGFVWVVPDFLEDEECRAWINFVESGNVDQRIKNVLNNKLEYVQHPATKYIAHRECYRWQQNNTRIADTLYQRMQSSGIIQEMQQHVNFSADPSYQACSCNPNIRLYKYEKGMSFGKHVDGSNLVDGVGQTEVTVLAYLSDCQGGATRFYPNNTGKKAKSIAFDPKQGSLLVHIHGDRCLEHEADPVVDGIKYILRTDVVFATGAQKA
jgi:hypothetical protein